MSSEEIRQSFLDFFKKKGHIIAPSSSLIPDDKSVLLTTAGMQQFKRYYTDELNALADFGSQRIASCQKCFRASDIEETGDKVHLTFLEMLGNFSFGPVGSDNPEDLRISGYFKRSSIHWAYRYLTEILEIPLNRIKVSVFEGNNDVPFDEESYRIWSEEIGITKEKIMMGNRADNFWGPTGDDGPCGPTTEIYVDGVEVWNLVFNEYYQEKSGKLRKLDSPGVDTGMGFERLMAVLQGVDNVFETDIFRDLISKINELAPRLNDKTVRVITDHLRASIFLIADGVRPSNKEAGYVLRRLLRRILAYQIKYDVHADLFPAGVEIIKEKFGNIYPEVNNSKIILEVLENERQKFQEAIGRGIKEIEKYTSVGSMLTAKEAFYLYETFGLPFELIKELAPKEITKDLSKEDFDKEFERHQELSRTASAGMFKGGLVDTSEKSIKLHTACHLLLESLRRILGNHVIQKGSNIDARRLRFDFSHPEKLTSEQIKQIEDMVNEKIKEDLPVVCKETTLQEAKVQNATGVFEHKYGEKVKAYIIGDSLTNSGQVFSKEICGGPHVKRTGELRHFKIIKEETSSAGVRRIKAVLD